MSTPAVAERRPAAAPPLIFISHDSRDAELAEAFENLLTDASGGVLKAFRSSDRKGLSGIEFGAEWYATIMSKLGDATDVVAILTQQSLGRPWILYEVGVARGRLNTPAFGIAFGVTLNQISGPFAQFQNSGDDEDSLTKLVLQLIKRNPEAAPREEAVRRQVAAFRSQLPTLTQQVSRVSEPPTEPDSVAKLFEEVKAMFRELPLQIGEQLRRHPPQYASVPNDMGWLSDGFRLIDKLATAEPSMRADRWSEFISWIWDKAPDVDRPAYQIYRALGNDPDHADLRTAHASFAKYLSNLRRRPDRSREGYDAEYVLERAADLIDSWVEKSSDVIVPPKRKRQRR